ncbi:putative nuclease HARBI1 isoform X1 [Ixodes scapularis]|uniref:putative nuclease HARBI1 isoform X1 n=1 Tax=Ixodes scapularis TaxID=6945 RepID=UPI001AD71228|nr:putative nuclease HARBI1 isoform X1 [Ixodes scapularis]
MVVCDADCRIMCIDPRYPGSVHDSFVWQFSWLRNQLEQGQVPRDGRFLLGDSGYPLEPWLITPVPGNHATSTACGRFNKAHSSIRSVVERCIGLLKNRFRCLQRHRALYYHPSTATAIISACAVLHYICLASSEPEPESDSDPEESELESEPSSERSASAPERLAPAGPPVGLPVGLSDRGKALRQRLVARFGTRRRRARAERHTQGVRRHDGSPDHQGLRREAPQRPRCGGAQHGRRQRQGTSRHHD